MKKRYVAAERDGSAADCGAKSVTVSGFEG
jgi:hypothetical protein